MLQWEKSGPAYLDTQIDIYTGCTNVLQTVANLTHSQRSLNFDFTKYCFTTLLFSYYECDYLPVGCDLTEDSKKSQN